MMRAIVQEEGIGYIGCNIIKLNDHYRHQYTIAVVPVNVIDSVIGMIRDAVNDVVFATLDHGTVSWWTGDSDCWNWL